MAFFAQEKEKLIMNVEVDDRVSPIGEPKKKNCESLLNVNKSLFS